MYLELLNFDNYAVHSFLNFDPEMISRMYEVWKFLATKIPEEMSSVQLN